MTAPLDWGITSVIIGTLYGLLMLITKMHVGRMVSEGDKKHEEAEAEIKMLKQANAELQLKFIAAIHTLELSVGRLVSRDEMSTVIERFEGKIDRVESRIADLVRKHTPQNMPAPQWRGKDR